MLKKIKLMKDVESIIGEDNFDKKSYKRGFEKGFEKSDIKNMLEHLKIFNDVVKESKKKVKEIYLNPLNEVAKAFQRGKSDLEKKNYEKASEKFGFGMGIVLKWVLSVTDDDKITLKAKENVGTYVGRTASILENSGNKKLSKLKDIKKIIRHLKRRSFLEELIEKGIRRLNSKFSEKAE